MPVGRLPGTLESEKKSEVILKSWASIITTGLTWWLQHPGVLSMRFPACSPLACLQSQQGLNRSSQTGVPHTHWMKEEYLIEIDPRASVIPATSINRREWSILIPKLRTRQLRNLMGKNCQARVHRKAYTKQGRRCSASVLGEMQT